MPREPAQLPEPPEIRRPDRASRVARPHGLTAYLMSASTFVTSVSSVVSMSNATVVVP